MKIFYPMGTIERGFGVTTMAESNKIFRSKICFVVINMMNVLAFLSAYCASIVIALANHLFESIIKRFWIWLKRFTALPEITILSDYKKIAAINRTKRTSEKPGTLLLVLFPALYTGKSYAPHPGFIKAFPGAIFTNLVARIYLKGIATMRTIFDFLAALPPRGFVSSNLSTMFGMSAIIGTITRSGEARESFISFSAMLTNFRYFAVLGFWSPGSAGIRTIRGNFGTVRMYLKYFAAEFAGHINHVFHNMNYTI